jgi:thiamine kinase-like enzyme
MEGQSLEKEITKNVNAYLLQNNSQEKENYNLDRISLKFEKLGGMCNENYLVKVLEKNSNKIIFQLVYKKFGIMSKTGEHLLESYIIEYLSRKDIGPKLYLEKKNYRLMEYIPETRHIEKDILFNDRIIDQLSLILDTYNHFTSTYLYHINGNKIEIEPLKDNDDRSNKTINVTKTYYDNIYNVIYKKAKLSFNKFKKEFEKKIPLKDNEDTHKIVNGFQHYLDNFQENFNKFYPKEGFLVMCHNDVNRYNFIQKISDGKLYCLDHEYASLNLPGYDIADYFNETNFNFVPNYYFSYDDIDYDKYFGIYKKYINKFIESHDRLYHDIKGKEFIEYISTKKYYLSLHQIINYFWFLCCIAYLDFGSWHSGKKASFYIANDLIRFYELGLQKLKE